ncbi:hypothetical protein O3M35_011079 [Rhynocoris fuscipes]|uniref:Uncharacterized protein n=1 Tax=Rhynocoris fuscipes TaxID=488301 RepID=A0AAW1CWA3_9HEMI
MNESEEQVSADSTKSGVPLLVPVMESYPYQSYPAPVGHPVPPMSLPLTDINTAGYPCTPIPVNLMAPKSLNVDGSDLPHSDVSTLRFFYNLGLDHMRMNCYLRPGTSYYVTSNGAYVPVENFPAQHLDNNMPSQPQPQGVKKNNVYEGPPLIQQNEVSSTNNLGVTVPMSQAYYPATAAVECEPYCMTVPSYVDYGICDYSPVYTPTHPFPPPSSYVTPDGVIYQQILPPGIVPATPPM